MIKQIYKKLLSEKMRITLRLGLRYILSPLYIGNKYHCGCCNRQARKFLDKGNIRRKNAECPFCHSLERTRILYYYLRNELNIFECQPTPVILHIAPEKGIFKHFKNFGKSYIDGDINPAYARNIVDITSIPYPDDYFDLIICSHVLGHVPDEKKAIEEMYRVLKPCGIALVMTLLNQKDLPTYEDENISSPEERLIKYGERDLCRLHGNDMGVRLSIVPFRVTQIDYRSKFTIAERTRFSLGNGEREMIFHCQK